VHDTVAEMMIFANAAVARRIQKAYPMEALVRRHGAPSQDRFNELIMLGGKLHGEGGGGGEGGEGGEGGSVVKTGSNRALAVSLNRITETTKAYGGHEQEARHTPQEGKAGEKGRNGGGKDGEDDGAVDALMRMVATRAMTEAEYISTGGGDRDRAQQGGGAGAGTGAGAGGEGAGEGHYGAESTASPFAHYGLGIPW
jgi:hypothetical protein